MGANIKYAIPSGYAGAGVGGNVGVNANAVASAGKGGGFLSNLLGGGLSALTGNPLGLLAIILPSIIGGIGAISQGVRSNRYYEDYLSKLEQNQSDMRKSLQARQQAYLNLENIIFGHQISNPYTYGGETNSSSKSGTGAYNSYLLNKSFRRR